MVFVLILKILYKDDIIFYSAMHVRNAIVILVFKH